MTGERPTTGALAAQYAVSLLAVVVIWDVYVRISGAPAFLLPPPAAVFAALAGLGWGGLLPHIGYTLGNLLLGFFLGSGIGVVAGLAMHHLPRLERALRGPILFLQTAPKIALAPLFVIWFGLGIASKIALIVSLVAFPVLIGTLAGLGSIDSRLIDLGRLLKLGWFARFRRIELPSAMPEIFVGLKIGAVQAVVGAILAEWMAGKAGLGYLMTFATATYKTPLLFAAVLLTVLLGIVIYFLLDTLERHLFAWRDAA